MSTSDENLPAKDVQRAAVERSDPRDRVGEVIDNRYRVIEFIGQGGMGNVYRAEHVTIRRPVALKLLHPALAQIDAVRKRFEREAFAIGRIDHPNCVNVSDFGKLDDGSLYLVMEFLQGESLGDLLDRERRMPPTRALHIARHVLRGLGHAHRAGIVHRDVKPENVVLVENEGDPDFAKILDFGIAKLIDVAEANDVNDKLTQAGVAFGTPIYLSPEQAIGEAADPRSDLYSVAVMMFEMIIGRPPFYSEDKLQILAMHTTKPPPAFSDVFPGLPVPESVEQIVRRGLAKSPADRFADADAFIAAIDQVLPPDSAGTPTPIVRAPSEAGGVRATTDLPAVAARDSSIATPAPPFQSGSMPIPGGTPVPHMTTPVPGTSTPGAYGHPTTPIPPYPSTTTPVPQSHTTPVPPFGTNVAAPRSRVPYLIALLAMIGIAIFLYKYTDSGSQNAEMLSGETEEPADKSVEEAEQTLAGGDSAQTIVQLLSREGIEKNPMGQLQLGHAYSARSEYEAAVTAYALAVELDPRLGGDEKMHANLRLMTDDDGPVFPEAAKLLVRYANDMDSVKLLLELAAGKAPERRRQAFAILKELGLDERIDRVRSFSWDLRQGKNCEQRKEAVAKLRALGDPAAIETLSQATKGRKRRRANRCLLQAAQDAIKYLRSLPDAGPATPDSDAKRPDPR